MGLSAGSWVLCVIFIECGAVSAKDVGGIIGPSETARVGEAFGAQGFTQAIAGGHLGQALGDAIDAFRVEGLGGIGDDLVEGPAARTQDGAAAGHCFGGWQPEAFEQRGVDHGIGSTVEVRQNCVFNKAEEANILDIGRGPGGVVDAFGSVPITAAENEEPRGTGGGFETVEGFDEADVVFGGMFETRDVEEKGSVEIPPVCGDDFCGWHGTGKKALVVNPVQNDLLTRDRNAEELLDIPGGIGADSDQAVLAPGQAFDDDASVKHASGVVLAMDVEGSEVMNCGDESARLAEEQAAVTGDVENIQTEPAGERGQHRMMPGDITDRRAEALGDVDAFGAALGEIKERPIVFENEEREMGRVGGIKQGADEGQHVLADAGSGALDHRGREADPQPGVLRFFFQCRRF